MTFKKLFEAVKKEWDMNDGKNVIGFQKSKPGASNDVSFEIERVGDKYTLTRLSSSSKTGKHSESDLEFHVVDTYMESAMEYYKLPPITVAQLNSMAKK